MLVVNAYANRLPASFATPNFLHVPQAALYTDKVLFSNYYANDLGSEGCKNSERETSYLATHRLT